MLDQNTTTIITSAFTVIGTLSGALERGREKDQREIQRLLKRYTLLSRTLVFVSKKMSTMIVNAYRIQDDLSRARTLVYLYLPSIRGSLDAFIEAFSTLMVEVINDQEDSEPLEVWEDVVEENDQFIEKLTAIKSVLEKLVQ